jgi:diguanylate cyclase (GGDEF)-like protein
MKPCVLIVDDQPANVRLMAEALGKEYELRFATSGVAAIETASSGGVDLILLDVVMPDLDGFEVCRRLKSDERTGGIPIIFVTAREETEDEATGFDAGGVDYITKPAKPAIVRARVRTHLELKQSRDLLAHLAMVDPLTGIPNRRRFDTALQIEWSRAARNQRSLSLAILDVDYFKRFNDTYGHARGDECLRAIASTASVLARRPGELAARIGGEEFALILPDTDAGAMRDLMGGLLERVHELSIEHAGSEVASNVTISIGAVTLRPEHEESPSDAVRIADQMLYHAKESGRAHCVHHDLLNDVRLRIRR